jgi:tight adherence protein B
VDHFYNLFIILVFIAAVLLMEGIYLLWDAYKGPEAERIERRLRAMSAGVHNGEGLSIVKKRLLAETPSLDRFLLKIPRIHHLDRLLLQSGLSLNVASFLWLTFLGLLAGFMLAIVFGLPLLVFFAAGIAGGVLPLLYVLNVKRKRMAAFEQQLPDALDLMGRALRAGHAFPSALKMVGDEMTEPVSGEFRTTFDELNYGASAEDALQNMATRLPSDDLRYFVIAVLIQRETGGNLSELLNNISVLIRERLKLLGTVRVLASEGRLSAWILGLLPVILTVVLNIINPKFMNILWTDPAGVKLLWITLGMMIIGVFWLRRIIRIHV